MPLARHPVEGTHVRYAPGSIAVSADADIPVLRAVHRAGHLTVHQLYSALYGAREKRLWDGLAWRVGRLVRTGLLDRTEVVGLKGAVLSLGTDGELCLQGHDSSLVDRGRRMRGGNKRHQIWHDVELFEIQLALRRAGVVATWEAECEIRAANDYTTDRYAKDYDAVVAFQCGGRRGVVALEYERTPKSSAEYERICAEIARDQKVEIVLYLVPSRELKLFLMHALRNTRRTILIGDAREFSHSPQSAPLVDVRTQRSHVLSELLLPA